MCRGTKSRTSEQTMRGGYGLSSPNTCCQQIQPFHMSGRRQEEFITLSPEHLIFFRPWTALINRRWA